MKTILILAAAMLVSGQAHAINNNFHNVEIGDYKNAREEFRSQGMGPASLSVYWDAATNRILSAGTFTRAAADQFAYANLYVINGYEPVRDEMARKGYVPKQFSHVNVAERGFIKYNVIFAKPTHMTIADHSMKNEEFGPAYNDLIRKGYRIADYNLFHNSGVAKHAAIWVKDGKGFVFYHGLNGDQFAAKASELGAQGWVPDSLNIVTMPWGDSYAAIWIKPELKTVWHFGMSAAVYQQRWEEMNRKGYRVHKVVGYRGGAYFAAIWVK